MTQDRWERIKTLFEQARAMPRDQREDFLTRACPDTTERNEVRRLLSADRAADPADAAPAVTLGPGQAEPHARGGSAHQRLADDDIPERVGPYRVLGKLGAGGMGLVLAAVRDDEQLKGRVAIKLIKRGKDTDEIIRRFHIERQVLSALRHPNIARVLDAGATSDGRSYFVMEYVEGMAIDKYCDFHRLPLAERVRLFMKVCAAVHYAHQNLVVHRDIKPHNILVTPEGEPKLLDFGIAKLLNPDMQQIAVFTGADLRLLTPEYASPEQVSGGPISTSSDVYSLGVLLYELLTGVRPYEFKTRLDEEIRRVIMEVEPARPSTAITQGPPEPAHEAAPAQPPRTRATSSTSVTGTLATRAQQRGTVASTLRRELADDLDDIVLMAMRKAPRERYKSAQEFADDLARHLNGEPVIARPESPWYRMRKAARRHRTAVTIVAAFVVLITGAAVTLGVLWQRADRERRRAEVAEEISSFRAEQAVKLAARINDDVTPAVQALAGSIPAQTSLADALNDYIVALRERAAADPRLKAELASALEAKASIEFGVRGESLGRPESAAASLTEAMALRRELAGRPDATASDLQSVATTLVYIGDVQSQGLLQTDDALKTYAEAARIADTIPPDGPAKADEGPSQVKRLIATSLLSMGDLLIQQGRRAEASSALDRSMTIRRDLAARWPEDRYVQRDLSVGYNRLGTLAEREQKWNDAAKHYQSALDVRLHILDLAPKEGQTRRDVMISREKLVNVLYQCTPPGDSRAPLALAIVEARKLAEESPTDARAAWDLLRLRALDALLLSVAGDQAGAERLLAAVAADAAKAADKDHPDDPRLKFTCVSILEQWGGVLNKQGKRDEAVKTWRDASARAKALAATDPSNKDFQSTVEHIHELIAKAGQP